MFIILFRSRLTGAAGAEYETMAAEMLEHAETRPGFIDFTRYRGDDGERLTVIRWKDEETLEAWRQHARHRVAQKLGRDRWYASYHLEVAELVRESRFEKASVDVGKT